MQDTGAPTTHDKPGSSMYPVYSTDTGKHFSLEETVHYLLSVILVGVRGDRNTKESVLPVCDKPYLTNKRKIQKREEIEVLCNYAQYVLESLLTLRQKRDGRL